MLKVINFVFVFARLLYQLEGMMTERKLKFSVFLFMKKTTYFLSHIPLYLIKRLWSTQHEETS